MGNPSPSVRPRRLSILAIGTRGDVQPCVALGVGLREAGFDVRIATHASHAGLVQRAGLAMCVVGADPRDAIERARAGEGPERLLGRIAFSRSIKATAQEVMAERLRGCWQACREADAIIASPLAILAGYHIAEKLAVPLVRVFFVPMPPTGAYPAFGPRTRRLGARINRWTHELSHEALWLLLRQQANAARRDVLGLPPLSLRNPLTSLDRAQALTLNAYSSAFWPPPPDWESWIAVTGFWFLDHPTDWQPPPDLLRFLETDPSPVYVGFGSMPSGSPDEMTKLVTAALSLSGQRAILARGWGGLTYATNSAHLFFVDDVPHDWLFPRVAAVVHHGGLGTTGQALRAGVPSLIVPSLPDQRLAGLRVHELGLGPPPLPHDQLTVARLADGMRAVATDRDMQQRAIAISSLVRREDGVGRAVAEIQQYLSVALSRQSPAG